ncbi:MAG: DUF2608 domain-containing protein [Gammaproteobacteria bacterium]|nr:DUF2608 domain-containing protein [Gammaproteobacteria bacterium]
MSIQTMALYNKQWIINITKNVDLVLLDIDDVIITPKQYLCSSSWYGRYHTVKKYVLTPHNLIKDFYSCMNKTDYEAVNANLIDDMSYLAKIKPVLGFTARIISFASETNTAIKSSNMKFSKLDHSFHQNINDGIIYVGYNKDTAKSNNKGEFLNNLLETEQFKNITSILFVDDTLKNLQEVGDAVPSNIQFYGVHFTEAKAKLFCDYNQKELDVIADYQWQYALSHDSIPSNNEALANICYDWSN